MTEMVKLQLQEIFRLALEIEGCQVSVTPSAANVHVFRFPKYKSTYDIDIDGYWEESFGADHRLSLENCIKNLKEIIG